MESTFYTNDGDRIQEEAERIETIYIPNSEGGFDLVARLTDMGPMKLLLVAGGIASTPGDYFKFLTMHLNGGTYDSVRILSPKSVAEMQKIHTTGLAGTQDIDILGYCLGWYAFRTDDQGNVRELGHGGLYGTYCWIDLDRDLAMFFATNQPIRLVPEIYEPLHDKVMEIFPGPESVQTKIHEVKPAVIEEFSVSPSQINAGETATLTWIVTGTGITAVIEPDIGDISAARATTDRLASNMKVSPTKTTTYILTATTPAGDKATKSVTLTLK
jgi:CubicO group peptidase (beta-lactamase class C family)